MSGSTLRRRISLLNECKHTFIRKGPFSSNIANINSSVPQNVRQRTWPGEAGRVDTASSSNALGPTNATFYPYAIRFPVILGASFTPDLLEDGGWVNEKPSKQKKQA